MTCARSGSRINQTVHARRLQMPSDSRKDELHGLASITGTGRSAINSALASNTLFAIHPSILCSLRTRTLPPCGADSLPCSSCPVSCLNSATVARVWRRFAPDRHARGGGGALDLCAPVHPCLFCLNARRVEYSAVCVRTQEGPYTKYEAGETRAYYERAISILQSSQGLALWASRVDRCSRTPCAGPLATSSVAHH